MKNKIKSPRAYYDPGTASFYLPHISKNKKHGLTSKIPDHIVKSGQLVELFDHEITFEEIKQFVTNITEQEKDELFDILLKDDHE
jgi:hypothetical protein